MNVSPRACWGLTRALLLCGALIGTHGCSDQSPSLTTPEDAMLASGPGWEESSGVVTLNFDRPEVTGDGWALRRDYRQIGIIFRGIVVITNEVDYFTGYWRADRLPPFSGKQALSLGDYHWTLRFPLPWRSNRREWGWDFVVPVSKVTFSLRNQAEFTIACYNAGGGVVAQRHVVGTVIAPNGERILDLNAFQSNQPYSGTTVELIGAGMARCDVTSDGGVMDDLAFSPESEPELDVTCTPVLTRGQDVRCSVKVTPEAAATLVSRSARGSGFNFEERPNSTIPAGQASVWEGRAVATTTVRFVVDVDQNGRTTRLGKEAAFTVNARTWEPYQLTQQPAHSIELRGSDMLAYPSNGYLGNFSLSGLNPFDTPIDTGSGPNNGLSYFRERPPFIARGATIATHPVLYPPTPGTNWANVEYQRWYNDQNGRPRGTCTQADIPLLRAEVERHEGLTMATNSHFGIANTAFLTHRPESRLEALYGYNMPEARLRHEAYNVYLRFVRNQVSPAQRTFDSADYARIQATLGCLLDNNRADN